MKSKLGVNIDHVATLRNARGEDHPVLLKAAKDLKFTLSLLAIAPRLSPF